MYNPMVKDDPEFKYPKQSFGLKLIGAWPLKYIEDVEEKKPSFLSHRTVSILWHFWSLYLIINMITFIYIELAYTCNNFDLGEATEILSGTFSNISAVIRFVHFKLNEQLFSKILRKFTKHIWIKRSAYPEIKKSCERNTRPFLAMMYMSLVVLILYTIGPLFEYFSNDPDSMDRPLPYKTPLPISLEDLRIYGIIYVISFIVGLCVVIMIFAFDGMFGFLLIYTWSQYLVLHQNIDNLMAKVHTDILNDNGEQFVLPQHFQRAYTKRLKEIAHKHAKIMEFARLLEKFYSPVMLPNYLTISTTICMTGFQVITVKNFFITDYVKFAFFISTILTQLYIICYNGDLLMQYSTETADHLYGCNWQGKPNDLAADLDSHALVYDADKEFRKNLEFMIMVSQKPVYITAYKFAKISLESFASIIQTSVSYLTLLQSFYN